MLAMISQWAIVQFFVEVVLLALHIALATFISREIILGTIMFKNAFYYIFVLQSMADVADYVMVVYLVRLPSYAAISPTMLVPFAPFLVFLGSYFQFFQLLAHTLIALNRYTVVLHPLRHRTLWRGTLLKLAIPFLFICPLFVAAPRLWIVVVVVDLGGGAFAPAFVEPTINMIIKVASTLFVLPTCTLSAFFTIRALVAFHRLDSRWQKEHNEDYRLLVFALVGFASQLSLAAYWAIQYSVGTNVDVKRILVMLMPFVIDLLSLSGSVCLLITSRTVRQKFFKVFLITPKMDAQLRETRVVPLA